MSLDGHKLFAKLIDYSLIIKPTYDKNTKTMPKYRALMDLFHNNYLFLTVFSKDQ